MKRIINLTLVSIFTLSLVVIAKAQYGIINLSNGTTVVVKTQVTPQSSKRSFGNIYSSNSGNIIHRVLTDKKNRIYFGYDLLIERQEETGRFKVSIQPLSKRPNTLVNGNRIVMSTGKNNGSPNKYGPDYTNYTEQSLPNYPSDFMIDDGDTLTLDLLENPQTKAKISDSIKITYRSNPSNFYYIDGDDKPAKDYSIEDVMLQIERPKIYVNEKEYKSDSTIAGKINWIYIEGKGRFIFSFKPQPKYSFQKIGTISNNKLSFEFNGDKYEFVSKTPILGKGGKWHLWVMHDPNYQPGYKMTEENPFVFGAAGKVEYVFDRR